MVRKQRILAGLAVLLFTTAVWAAAPSLKGSPFTIHPITENDYSTFVKVFGEMRGPLRQAILKDRKSDFENADPLAYVAKVKEDKDVKKAIKNAGLTWDSYNDLMANLLLGYFSIQPQRTKMALIQQLAGYGLAMNLEAIPEEYREQVTAALKTPEGAMLAGAVFDLVVQVPPQNIAIARAHEKDLDRMFYTKYWRDELGGGKGEK